MGGDIRVEIEFAEFKEGAVTQDTRAAEHTVEAPLSRQDGADNAAGTFAGCNARRHRNRLARECGDFLGDFVGDCVIGTRTV
jgi:hypothetical protein